MPVERRKVLLKKRLKLDLWRHKGLILYLLLHILTAPVCAQFSGSGSGSGSSSPFFSGSADGSGDDDIGSGDSGSGECLEFVVLYVHVRCEVAEKFSCIISSTKYSPSFCVVDSTSKEVGHSRTIVCINNTRA